MNVSELLDELRSRGIPENAYSIGQDSNESYCLIGAYGTWHTYYSERGLRTAERIYTSEDAACRDLLGRLVREFQDF